MRYPVRSNSIGRENSLNLCGMLSNFVPRTGVLEQSTPIAPHAHLCTHCCKAIETFPAQGSLDNCDGWPAFTVDTTSNIEH